LFSWKTSHAVSAESFLAVVNHKHYGSQLQLPFEIPIHKGENYETAFQNAK